MILAEALKLFDYASMTDQQVLDYGNTVVVIATDDSLWRAIGVGDRFGPIAAQGLYDAINATGLTAFGASYISPGINLSLDVTQTYLDTIATAAPPLASLCAALKQIGVTHDTRWAGWGLPQPTLGDITAARQQLTDQIAKTLLMGSVINAQKDDLSVSFDQFRANIAAFVRP